MDELLAEKFARIELHQLISDASYTLRQGASDSGLMTWKCLKLNSRVLQIGTGKSMRKFIGSKYIL